MKSGILILLCFFGIATAGLLRGADSVSDWIGNGKAPSNLSSDAEGLFVQGKPLYIFSAKEIPVKKDGKYVLTGTFRRTNGNSVVTPLYFGLALYDENGKILHGFQTCPIPGSDTELAEAAKAGDRVLKVKDASRWVTRASIVAFGTKADGSDIPNRDISPVITHIEKTGSLWNVTFRRPLKKAYPAGTAVRQQTGGPYIYVCGGVPLTDQWKTFLSPVFHGVGLGGGKLWKGTRNVKIVVFGTIGKPVGIRMKNVEFKEVK